MSRINVADLSTGGEVGGGVPRVCALVFFASASFRRLGHRIGGPRRAWRIVRSRPRAAARWASISVVKVLSRSRIAHCAINSGHCVMEPAFQGVRFHDLSSYVINKPTLICYLTAPIADSIDLRRFEHLIDDEQSWPRWLRCCSTHRSHGGATPSLPRSILRLFRRQRDGCCNTRIRYRIRRIWACC